MSSSESNVASPARVPKSPVIAALAISCAIAAGTVASTLDAAIFDELVGGKWLMRPVIETQARNTAAIASLEQSVGAVALDLDFIAARAAASMRRNEDLARDRFAELDARFAGLKERFARVQEINTARAPTPEALPGMQTANARLDTSGDVSGLRSSLHDLAAANSGAVRAITRRLDRIEVMVGISTDVMSSASDPAARQAARRNFARPVRTPTTAPVALREPEAAAPEQTVARPERGHLFNIKPVSQQGAPLRVSRLPG